MDEQQEVIVGLETAGVLGGVRWAYRAAVGRALEVFSEADGHDAALLGILRFTLFRDRLDRVFACDHYELQPGSAATVQLDLLYSELSLEDSRTMPHLSPDLVRRADLAGSPGWATGRRRFLLASCAYGKLDCLPWPRGSPTKQRVARQMNPESHQPSLFEDVADEECAGVEELLAAAYTLDLETFVVAHSLDSLSQDIELIFGRARLNSGGGKAWHWSHDLLAATPADGGRRNGEMQVPAGRDTAPDAPVRLRRKRDELQGGGRATGVA